VTQTVPAARFAAAYALLRAAAAVGDHWVIAADAVSTLLGVSLSPMCPPPLST